MLRGYRVLLFAACIGLAFVTFGLGLMLAASDAQEERYQPYRYATDKPLEVDPSASGPANAQSLQDRTPCDNPKGETESDLCAQWRAANAAEDSAFWTQWGFWIGVIGSSLLLWQIALTRQAVEDTGEATEAMRKANEIASDTAKKQLRAYVSLSSARGGNFGPNKIPRFDLEAKNTGVTPAIDFRADSEFYLLPAKELPPTEIPDISAYRSQILGAGQPAPTTPKLDRAISDNEWAQLVSGDLKAFYTFYAEYKDIFGDSHKFGMHGYVSGLPDKLDVMPVPGSVIFT